MELGGEDVVAPAVVAGFGNAEELGEACHLVAGYPSNQHMSEAGMTALLDQHQDFAIRCSTCNSDPLMFFGPVKELLWVVVDREYRRPPVLRQHAAAIWSRLRLLYRGGR